MILFFWFCFLFFLSVTDLCCLFACLLCVCQSETVALQIILLVTDPGTDPDPPSAVHYRCLLTVYSAVIAVYLIALSAKAL